MADKVTRSIPKYSLRKYRIYQALSLTLWIIPSGLAIWALFVYHDLTSSALLLIAAAVNWISSRALRTYKEGLDTQEAKETSPTS